MGTRQAVVGAAVAAGVLALGGCGWFDLNETTDDQTIGEAIGSLQFDVDSGDITVRTGDTTSVRRIVHYDETEPGSTVRVDGDALILEECQARNCWIDYEVVVPAGTTVNGQVDSGNADVTGVASANLRASSGDVHVREVPGEVNVTADSGSIDVSGVDGAVTLVASSGDVAARGIGGAAQVDSDSGSVTVELTTARDVRVDGDSGDIEVTVPPASYQVRTSTDSGDLDVADELTADDAAGDHVIDLQTDSGSITVRQS